MLEFDSLNHKYYEDGRELISVTTLLKKHGLSSDYSMVNETVLKKKARRGTVVHAEIEDYIKNSERGFTDELYSFISICSSNALIPLASETMASRDALAGTIDLQGVIGDESRPSGAFIGDIKTCAKLNIDSCRWQLSLYAWLLDKKFDKYYIFHLLPEGSSLVEVKPIPDEEINRLLWCEENGLPFKNTTAILAGEDINEIEMTEMWLDRLMTDLKNAKQRAEERRQSILQKMIDSGVKTLETDKLKMTVIDEYTRQSVDTARLKDEQPEIYSKYLKTAVVKPSLKIAIKP